MAACRFVALIFVAVAVPVTGAAAGSKSFNITNSCTHTVWPGISSSGSGTGSTSTGLELAPGQSLIVSVPSGWSGRVWGRTLCSTDSSGRFTCLTGDCGSGREDCAGGNAAPPATLAQFTLNGSGGVDFYDVSLVDGYNLPMVVAPKGAASGGNCAPTGCVADLNHGACPAELRVTSSMATGAVACKSACLAFGSPQYCCTGAYGTPDTCQPSSYSQLFKSVCPRASSYAFDRADSIFTCGGTTYTITFCPDTASGKSSTSPNSQPPGAAAAGSLPPPHIDGSTTPYTGGSQVGGATAAPWRIGLILGVVAAALSVLANFLGLFRHCCNQAAAAGAGA